MLYLDNMYRILSPMKVVAPRHATGHAVSSAHLHRPRALVGSSMMPLTLAMSWCLRTRSTGKKCNVLVLHNGINMVSIWYQYGSKTYLPASICFDPMSFCTLCVCTSQVTLGFWQSDLRPDPRQSASSGETMSICGVTFLASMFIVIDDYRSIMMYQKMIAIDI